MSPVGLAAGGLLAFGLVLVALAIYLRMARRGAASDPVEELPVVADGTLAEKVIDRLTAPFGRQGRASRTTEALSRANLQLRAQEWYLVRALVPVVLLLLVFLLSNNPVVALLLAVAGFFVPGFLLRSRRDQRRAEVIKQLPEALQVMSNALLTGATVSQALQSVAESLPAPMGEEFGRIDREISLGVPLSESLDRLATRVDSRDLGMVVSAIEINRQMGGNLSTVLEGISGTMRERGRLKDRIRVLTSQVRLSSRLVSLLPVGVALVLLLIAPTYMAPLFSTVAGFFAIVAGVVLVALAYFVMGRITNIQV